MLKTFDLHHRLERITEKEYYFIINESIQLTKKYTFSFQLDDFNTIGVSNIEDIIIRQLLEAIQKEIYNSINDSTYFNIIDNHSVDILNLLKLISHNRRFLNCSTNYYAFLCNLKDFEWIPKSSQSHNRLMGKIGNCQVFLENTLSGYTAFLFDSIQLNFKINTHTRHELNSFTLEGDTQKYFIDFLFGFNIDNQSVIKLVDSKDSSDYADFLAQERDKKITHIIHNI